VVKNLAIGVGRRKTSVARVYLREGNGKVVINGRPMEKYFPSPIHVYAVQQPLSVTDGLSAYDITINVKGGGSTGQAEACRHGIARALLLHDENNNTALKANGFLTRDPRMVERKKYGHRKARRRFQFSKR
jgi:small subunit ribosomal protein S9